jgi:hypothetical protein
MAAALRGDVAATRELGQQALLSLPEDGFIRPRYLYELAASYAVAGINDQALDMLDASLAKSGRNFLTLRAQDPYLVSLRDEPRFQRLVDVH